MKNFIFAMLCFLNSPNSYSQQLETLWSDCIENNGIGKGIYERIVASSDTRIYALYKIYDLKMGAYYHHYYTLRAFDKVTMEIVKDVQITKKEDNNYKRLHKNPFSFNEVVLIDGSIIFFHSIYFDERAELHATVFDENLNIIKEKTKILETPNSSLLSYVLPKFFVSANYETNSILAGLLVGGNYKDTAILEYKIIDKDLIGKHSNKTTFPCTLIEYPRASYSLENDQTIFIQYNVKEDVSEEDTKKKDRKFITYRLIHVLSAKTGEFVNFPVYFENKDVSDLMIETENGICEITGFFKDLSKDPTGIKNHGLFKVQLDIINIAVSEPKFTYFSELEMNEIYRQDNVLAPMRKTKFVSIPEGLMIEDYTEMPNGDRVLFCTRLNNYSNSDKDITFYSLSDCDKLDVTCMRINDLGEIQWLRTFPRRYTIDTSYASDLSGIYDENSNSLICTFGLGEAQVVHKTDDEDVRTAVDYLLINAENGQLSPKKLELNAPTTSKSDKKYVIPRLIFSLDGDLYYHYYSDPKGGPMPMVTSNLEAYEALGCLGKFFFK